MIKNIIDGISERLYDTFGSDYEIYTEVTEQGIKEPCFMITLISPSGSRMLSDRVKREILFCIQYLPEEGDKLKDINDMIDDLYWALDTIDTIDDEGNTVIVRGTDMYSEITDQVLSFFVNYNYFEIRTHDKDLMEEISEEIEAMGYSKYTETDI